MNVGVLSMFQTTIMPTPASRMEVLESTVGVSDMVLLDQLSEDAVVSNLREKFMANQIYVSSISHRSDFISQWETL